MYLKRLASRGSSKFTHAVFMAPKGEITKRHQRTDGETSVLYPDAGVLSAIERAES